MHLFIWLIFNSAFSALLPSQEEKKKKSFQALAFCSRSKFCSVTNSAVRARPPSFQTENESASVCISDAFLDFGIGNLLLFHIYHNSFLLLGWHLRQLGPKYSLFQWQQHLDLERASCALDTCRCVRNRSVPATLQCEEMVEKAGRRKGNPSFTARDADTPRNKLACHKSPRNCKLSGRWPCFVCLAQDYPPTSFVITQCCRDTVWMFSGTSRRFLIGGAVATDLVGLALCELRS